jgi:hypothetical protein
MKKIIVLLICLLLSVPFFQVSAETVTTVDQNSTATQNTIVPQDQIINVANELGLENPEDIVQIEFSYDGIQQNPIPKPSSSIGSSTFGLFTAEYYLKNIVTTQAKGELLRSSFYIYPGGTMTITDSVSASFSTEVGVSASVISAKLGFNVTGTYSVSESQNVIVPYGSTYNLRAYVNYQVKSFEIWEDDIWFDDYLGTGKTKKPVGVIFVLYK